MQCASKPELANPWVESDPNARGLAFMTQEGMQPTLLSSCDTSGSTWQMIG